MKHSTLSQVSLLVVCCFLLSPVEVAAQRLEQDRLKSGKELRQAFSQFVKIPRQFTAQVLSGNKPVALGAVIEAEGWVLTKASELAADVNVKLADGKTYPANVVGIHPEFDLALLKIEAEKLTPVVWSDGTDPLIGRFLITPGIEEQPAAIGNMSVIRREISPRPGVMGISIESAQPGARINRIYPNSGAEKAELKINDIVIRLGGKEVKDDESLVSAVREMRPGDLVVVTVKRGEQELEVTVKLQDAPEVDINRGALQNQMGGRLSERRVGFPMVIQHDTVLTPEECGGPLVDLYGKVVGLNIARAGRTESYALPTSIIRPLLEDLKAGKYAPKVPVKEWSSRPSAPALPEE